MVSTANPEKFPALIEKAIGISPKSESLEILKSKKIVKKLMRASARDVRDYIEENAIRSIKWTLKK